MRLALVGVLVACASPPPARAPAPPPPAAPAVQQSAPAEPAPFAAQNLGFERVDGAKPQAWESRSGELATTSDEKHGGSRALVLDGERFALTRLDAAPYLNKRVIVRGWIKTKDSGGAGIWVRADGADGQALALDTMQERRVVGSAEWTAASVQIDVPASATGLVIGTLQLRKGQAWFDDLAVEIGEVKPPAQVALAGIVVEPQGAPAAGAEVALISDVGEIVQHVRTDAQGRFTFSVLEGRWGVSAHRAGTVGAFLAVKRFEQSTSDLKIVLGKDGGVTVRGKTSQQPSPGAYARISPVSDHDADLFAVPINADGTFEAVLPRGDEYYVSLLDGFGSGNFARKGDRVEAPLETPSLAEPPAEVVDYIRTRGIPLVSAEAGKGFNDLAPLGKLVGKARIVALGEATHGSREIFQMKHRVLEYLVAKQGFTVFAIEANQPECRAINDYVLHGKGSAREALDGIYFWTWNTEEVLAMIEWMRAWNADPAHAKKVQFAGFDMQTTMVAYKHVAAYLEKTVPDRAKALLAPIEALATGQGQRFVGKDNPGGGKVLTDGLAAIGTLLVKADADTRHDFRILEQATAMYLQKTSYAARDDAMAENVGWLLDHTKARIVLWAHNGHISNTLKTFENMGSHLRKKYKRDYVNIGFVFGEGSFQALDYTKPSRMLAEHTLATPPPYYLSTAFQRTGHSMLALDLRALPKRGKVADWFGTPHPVRELGAAFLGEKGVTSSVVIPQLFDAVIYIDKTTRARPVPRPTKR